MEALVEIGVGGSIMTYSEPGEYYFFMMGIFVSGGPERWFMFYQSEFIIKETNFGLSQH